MSKILALHELETILSQYLNFEKTPKKDALWLKNMELLCSKLDNPQKKYKSFHIAGSKGKGSVSSFIARILEEAKLSAGIFTSPHVSDISERLRKPSELFSNQTYQNALDEFKSITDFIQNLENNGGNSATWFELFTIYSFLCFEKAQVDWAVFEVGLGGRLDSTNVIEPEACIITPIELEHTEFLGDTIEKIAFEKAGIIKKGIPVFSAPQFDSVKKVFEQKAKEVGTSITFLNEKDVFHAELFNFIDSIELTLKGSIQKQNAKLAALAVKSILPKIDNTTILQGLQKTTIPCRFEVIKKSYNNKELTVVLDGCHTPNSVAICLDTFYKEFGSDNHLLFACAKDKDVEGMAEIIKKSPCNFGHITITEPGNVKQADFSKIENTFENKFKTQQLTKNKDYSTCIKNAIEIAQRQNKTLLCMGSFYLCAELLEGIKLGNI